MGLSKVQKLCIRALETERGDDLERAERYFRNLTPKQMRKQYGKCGRTCQQILDGYRSEARKIQKAIKWIKSR